jgi:hypothetical protein
LSESNISILSRGSLEDSGKDFLVFSSECWRLICKTTRFREKPDFAADQIHRRKRDPQEIEKNQRETNLEIL